jgi:DNA polymerase III epsilon subunit-like protein
VFGVSKTETMKESKLLFFDCETTGLPRNRNFSVDSADDWPHLVQIAWARYDSGGTAEDLRCHIVRPEGFTIPADATMIHGISHAHARRVGRSLSDVLDEFLEEAGRPGTTLVAHNLDYDLGVIGAELVRTRKPLGFLDLPGICTMKSTTELCQLPRPGGFGYKWPTLEELHCFVFGYSYEGAHDAASDIEACARSFFKLLAAGYFRI